MKIIVSNLKTNKSTKFELEFRPMVGDNFPIQYASEKVVAVCIVTQLTIESQPNVKGYDLLVFTE